MRRVILKEKPTLRRMVLNPKGGLDRIRAEPIEQLPSAPQPQPQPMQPHQYTGFLPEFGRNIRGAAMRTGGVIAGRGTELLEQAWGTTPESEKIKNWAENLYREAEKPKHLPSVGGGWRGFVAQAIGQAVPYMSAAVGATIATGTPLAAFGVGYVMEGEEAYQAALKSGATEEQAQTARFVVGTIGGAIEQLQAGQVLRFAKGGKQALLSVAKQKAAKSIIGKVGKFSIETVKHSAKEALEEALQEVTQIGSVTVIGNPPSGKEAIARVGSAALGGGVVGGVLGGGGRLITRTPTKVPTIAPEAITPAKPTIIPPKPAQALAKPAEVVKKVSHREAGFVDLSPIAEAGEQIRTTGQKATKLVTRFQGLEPKVKKVLIEYEEQMREVPKVVAKQSFQKYGKLSDKDETILIKHREQPTKYPLPEHLKEISATLDKDIAQAGVEFKALGYEPDWPKNYVRRLEQTLQKAESKEIVDEEYITELKEAIKEAQGLQYLHHYYKDLPKTKKMVGWFRRTLTRKPRRLLGRKIPTYEKAKTLGLKPAPLAVSQAHMWQELQRAKETAHLLDAINKNPNLARWENNAPSDWVYLNSRLIPESVQKMTWATKEGKVGQKIRRMKYFPPIAEAIQELTYARSSHAITRAYDRINFTLKIIGFYNPLVMGKNDLVQGWRAAGFKEAVYLPKALYTFIKKDAEYQMLRKNGLFNNVVNYTPSATELAQQMINKIRISVGARAAKKTAKALTHPAQTIRELNELTTWNMDEIVRIATWHAVKNSKMLRGLTQHEKVEWVNDAMVNYAKLPKGTKSALSRVFFVPTYRIGNLRFWWGQLAKHPWRYKGPVLRTIMYKMFVAFGLPAVIAAAIKWKTGKKEKAWTEKGYRVVIKDSRTGKETVYSLSDPLLEGAKLTQRTPRQTLELNLAAIPALMLRVLRGPKYRKTKDPYGEFFKLGTPIYRDIMNWKDPDKTVPQKILTQLAIAYVYTRKGRKQDKETASKALVKALSVWTDWKEQKEDVERMLGKKFYSLMSDKEIRAEIRKSVYSKPYRRKNGVLYPAGTPYSNKEDYVKELRTELRRRK